MNYDQSLSTETYKKASYRFVSCDINQDAKINGKLSLSLSYELHGNKLEDNPPIYLNDGRNVRLINNDQYPPNSQ